MFEIRSRRIVSRKLPLETRSKILVSRGSFLKTILRLRISRIYYFEMKYIFISKKLNFFVSNDVKLGVGTNIRSVILTEY